MALSPSITALYLQNIKTFQLFKVQMCDTRMDWSSRKGAVKKVTACIWGGWGAAHIQERDSKREGERERGGPS